jgi:large subunit ribosomal protein L4
MNLEISSHKLSGSLKTVNVSENVFGSDFNETLVHQIVTKYLSAARSGTKAQKTRANVSGGGAKPFRQKGTGRARAGTSRSPIWRSGGKAFAAQPRSFEQKLNKKMYRVGIRSILSELHRQERINIFDDIFPETHKTRDLLKKLDTVPSEKILIVVEELTENLVLAARNLYNVAVLTPSSLDPISLVSADKVFVTELAIKQIEEQLS